MKDFILDNSNDLATSEGDFLIDVPDLQNVSLLLSTTKGDWKESPAIGIGLIRYLDSPFSASQRLKMLRDISLQIELDGGTTPTIQFNEYGLLNINTYYK
ncbi:MAG: hypothetical protein PWR20_1208 [Bacteroidales bacterium]|jgi:hypothetical protein|nr:hypothetical protein [Bacteroidales bacterium]MDN5329392.1 hypothetical protein [Bacteroidales bacterium]NPV35709.1 hypothetical protein [Bacteroidales bacterium]